MGKLAGQIAWVTGAGSGIGEAVAVALAAEGAGVILTGRNRGKLDSVAARIEAAGGAAHVKPADLSRPAAVQSVADYIERELGRLDILVNNAGMNVQDRSWKQVTPEGLQDVVAANLFSAFHCAMAALPIMRAQGGGLMVHTASIAGRSASPLAGPAYSAAKHAVVAMSQSLNMEECGNGIRSSVMCPGAVRTPILENRPNKMSEKDLSDMLRPEDCAALVLFLATMPPHVCINEVTITPTRNRSYLAAMQMKL